MGPYDSTRSQWGETSGFQRFAGQHYVTVINSNYIYIEQCDVAIRLVNCNVIRIRDSDAQVVLINCNDVIMENCTGELKQINCNRVVSHRNTRASPSGRNSENNQSSTQGWVDIMAVKFEELWRLLSKLKQTLEEHTGFKYEIDQLKAEIEIIKRNTQIIARNSTNRIIEAVRRILGLIKNINFVATIAERLIGWLPSISLP